MKTFIRVTEIWVPSRDRTYLEHATGLYGAAPSFGASSHTRCFARGEGLPGQAWELGHPVILKDFENSTFRRTEAAREAGLTCGIALPIFAGDFLTSVLVLLCGENAPRSGALELWCNDPEESAEMTLHDGYYGAGSTHFENVSRHAAFAPGMGLPGMAWQQRMPVIIDDLRHATEFLRRDSTASIDLNRGFAFPCPTRDARNWVMCFLSAYGSPIARRVEIWAPDATRDALWRVSGFCEHLGDLSLLPDPPRLEAGQGTIGLVLLTGIPGVTEQAQYEPAGLGATAEFAGVSSLIAMPVIQDGKLNAVIAWYF